MEGRWACRVCNESFAESRPLKKHYLRAHDMEMTKGRKYVTRLLAGQELESAKAELLRANRNARTRSKLDSNGGPAACSSVSQPSVRSADVVQPPRRC